MRLPLNEVGDFICDEGMVDAAINSTYTGDLVVHKVIGIDSNLDIELVSFIDASGELMWDVFDGSNCITGLGGVTCARVVQEIQEYMSKVSNGN